MTMMGYYQLAPGSSHLETLKVLEADIQHANMLAASIPRAKDGALLQMKLVYNHFVPILWFLHQWMDCSCTRLLAGYLSLFHIVVYKVSPDGELITSSHARRATLREFYAIILPSLQDLHDTMSEFDIDQNEGHDTGITAHKRTEPKNKQADTNLEREDECGICLEPCTKIVLPSCCHAMCSNCYRDWNTRSESCPFCRGSLKRVTSGDLWVLTCAGDIVDAETLSKEDVSRFYLYVNSLPKDVPDALFMVYYEYLI